jgi:putative membrane protein
MNSLLLKRFAVIWLVSMLALWIVDAIFESLHFDSLQALALAALVLSLANLFLKPLLVLVTLPITVMTMGLMLPVINGFILVLVAELVPGFQISGFWMGVLAALAVSFTTMLINIATGQSNLQMRLVRGRHRTDGAGSGSAPSNDPNVIDVEVKEKEK